MLPDLASVGGVKKTKFIAPTLPVLPTFRMRAFRPRAQLLLVLAVLVTGLLTAPSPAVAQAGTQATVLDSALARVDTLRATGDFQAAFDRLRSLRDTYGGRGPLLWRMSVTQIDLARSIDDEDAVARHYEEGLTFADAALAADSSSARAHYAKAVAEGRLALDAGRKERIRRSRAVKQHADRAIALDSTLDGAFHTRARWHREVSDLNFFERAIVKTIYGGLPDASFEASVRDFKRAIELHDERFHHLELAKTYIEMDREQAAREELNTVLEMPAREPFDPRYATEAQKLLDDLD